MAVSPYSQILLFANNAQSSLAGSISNSSTTITLQSGGGAPFPAPTAGQGFPATLTDRATGLLREIVLVTAKTGDTLTVTRAQEGTTGLAWAANDLFAQLVTAGGLTSFVQGTTAQAQEWNYGVDVGTANAYQVNLAPAVSIPKIGMPLRVLIANSNTGPSTMNYGAGAVNILRADGSACIGNELVAGQTADFIIESGNVQLVAPAPATTAAIAAGTDTRSFVNPAQLSAASIASVMRSYIAGLTLSAAGGTGTFGITGGSAADSTNSVIMKLTSAYTKTTAAWAVGSGNGSLDTGSIGNNTWYHVYEIRRPDTGVVDILISTNPTVPTALPANYTQYRRIGSMRTNGSAQWMAFQQIGDDFYKLQVVDQTYGLTQAATLQTLSVPTGIIVEPFLAILVRAVNNNTGVVQIAPAANATLFTEISHYEGDPSNGSSSTTLFVGPPTNTAAQVYVGIVTPSGDIMSVSTYGWRDYRGSNL